MIQCSMSISLKVILKDTVSVHYFIIKKLINANACIFAEMLIMQYDHNLHYHTIFLFKLRKELRTSKLDIITQF